MSKILFLPELHDFTYEAIVPWPRSPHLAQQDWVTSIETIESWLNQYCGHHWAEWAYSTSQDQQYWEACIAFRRERNRTLFLLTWA